MSQDREVNRSPGQIDQIRRSLARHQSLLRDPAGMGLRRRLRPPPVSPTGRHRPIGRGVDDAPCALPAAGGARSLGSATGKPATEGGPRARRPPRRFQERSTSATRPGIAPPSAAPGQTQPGRPARPARTTSSSRRPGRTSGASPMSAPACAHRPCLAGRHQPRTMHQPQNEPAVAGQRIVDATDLILLSWRAARHAGASARWASAGTSPRRQAREGPSAPEPLDRPGGRGGHGRRWDRMAPPTFAQQPSRPISGWSGAVAVVAGVLRPPKRWPWCAGWTRNGQ